MMAWITQQHGTIASMTTVGVLTVTAGTGLVMLLRIHRHMRCDTERRRRVEAVTLQALEAVTLQMEPPSSAAPAACRETRRTRHLTAIPPAGD